MGEVHAAPSSASGQVFYRYEDPSGRVVIVDSLSKVPSDARAYVERLHLDGRSVGEGGGDTQLQGSLNVVPAVATTGQPGAGTPPAGALGGLLPPSFDGGSFGAGFGLGIVVVAFAMFFIGRSGGGGLRRMVFGAALIVGLAALASGAYLGWLRRTTGLGGEAFAAPGAVIQDARKAVEDMQKHRAEQERLLQEIDEIAK